MEVGIDINKRKGLPICPNECKYFETCSAPFCPMDKSISNNIWYPDEEICKLQAFSNESWIRSQKKIVKKSRKTEFYFTYRMLQQNCIIAKGMEGLDSDDELSVRDREESRWLKQHPEKRILTEDEREKLRKKIMKVRQGHKSPRKDRIPLEKMNFSMPSA